mmetsp:Transcript_41811/g.87516  ORF Transcript_41811/g.87516 Transcript_41811/m.87516 type:complete len:282 (+) Transcript_41811:502-1347(+)
MLADRRIRTQQLERDRRVLLQELVFEEAILKIESEVVQRLGNVELNVFKHRLLRSALPVLPVRASVEEGLEVGRVQVDEALVGGERQLCRERDGHVRVGAREDEGVAGAHKRDAARAEERGALGLAQRRREERVVERVEHVARLLAVGPHDEQLGAAKVLANVGPANLVDVHRRAGESASDKDALVVPVPIRHRIRRLPAEPILHVKATYRLDEAVVDRVAVLGRPPQFANVHARRAVGLSAQRASLVEQCVKGRAVVRFFDLALVALVRLGYVYAATQGT